MVRINVIKPANCISLQECNARRVGTFFPKVPLGAPLGKHVALNRGLMIVFVTLMRCDDCKAQQPAAAGIECNCSARSAAARVMRRA